MDGRNGPLQEFQYSQFCFTSVTTRGLWVTVGGQLKIQKERVEIMQQPSMARDGLIWCISEGVCALQDGERHLGHIVKTGSAWRLYDATHLNLENDGMRDLGYFSTLDAAKAALEASVASPHEKQSLRMAC